MSKKKVPDFDEEEPDFDEEEWRYFLSRHKVPKMVRDSPIAAELYALSVSTFSLKNKVNEEIRMWENFLHRLPFKIPMLINGQKGCTIPGNYGSKIHYEKDEEEEWQIWYECRPLKTLRLNKQIEALEQMPDLLRNMKESLMEYNQEVKELWNLYTKEKDNSSCD